MKSRFLKPAWCLRTGAFRLPMHMRSATPARRLTGALLLLCCLGAHAQVPVPHYEEEEKPDTTVALPPAPKLADLQRFPTSWTDNQIFIDTASLVFGDDDTLSYTLVVRGAGGANNVTFESLRCRSGERRVLAYGRNDGTWSRARSSNWMRIVDQGINRYYYEFWIDTFCSGKTLEPKRTLLDNVRKGGRERIMSIPD